METPAETSVLTELTIHITGFGHPDKVRHDHLQTVGRDLYHIFGTNFFMVFDGHVYHYDPSAPFGEQMVED